MRSFFSRSTSSLNKGGLSPTGSDEFGRLKGRRSFNSLGTTAKEKKERPDKSGTLKSATVGVPQNTSEAAFLLLNLEPPSVSEDREQEHPGHSYGYLSYKRHVILGTAEVARLVDVVTEELSSRGLTTPFLFSSLALDVSAPAVNRLIDAFLQTCHVPDSQSADSKWREEARFAEPHELGICLRWGLARVVRVVGGKQVRGLLSYDSYVQWRDTEIALNYPPAHFRTFLVPLEPVVHTILVTLLALLIRLTAHSSASGHTPPTLSPLFGPLVFGLGAPSLSFHHAYHYYLRAAHATEHIILAFTRWQEVDSGTRGGLGIPARLKDWIRGYPSMLPTIPSNKQDKPQPRKGARTVRVANVRRNVRMYSPDLVKTAASWGYTTTSSGENTLTRSKEWEMIAPKDSKLAPMYSDNFRKRMNLASGFHPESGSNYVVLFNPARSSVASGDGTLVSKPGNDRFKNLSDLKWGEFEEGGFGSVATDEDKLQFDLTEGARVAHGQKIPTLTWTDFSTDGFSRTESPLSTSLQLSAPVTNSINDWPAQFAKISKKWKKIHKSLPVFGWDTEPIMASEEVIEEAFVDVFCDLVYGSGWMDLERGEEVDRDCSWALIEFKSLPDYALAAVSPGQDPRTSTTLVVFEEFVPLEYRQQLAESRGTKNRLSFFLSPPKAKEWKQASTLNGRPYVVGTVPPPPHFREVEFEGILRGDGSSTRIIRMDSKSVKLSPTTPLPVS